MRKVSSRHATGWIALIGWLALGCPSADDVLPVYLTWSHEDTTTTMTVHYHTVGPAEGSHVYYDVAPRGGDPASYAYHATGFEKRLEGVDRSVHVVELTGLEPGTSYHFVVGDPLSGFREERRFRRPGAYWPPPVSPGLGPWQGPGRHVPSSCAT